MLSEEKNLATNKHDILCTELFTPILDYGEEHLTKEPGLESHDTDSAALGPAEEGIRRVTLRHTTSLLFYVKTLESATNFRWSISLRNLKT